MEPALIASLVSLVGGIGVAVAAWMKIWCPYRLKMEALRQKGNLVELKEDLGKVRSEKEKLVEQLVEKRVELEVCKAQLAMMRERYGEEEPC